MTKIFIKYKHGDWERDLGTNHYSLFIRKKLNA